VVGFGLGPLGGWSWGGTKKNDPQGAIRAALDHGINLIDTAPMYGYGHSEKLVGKAYATRSCWPPSAAFATIALSDRPLMAGSAWGSELTRGSCGVRLLRTMSSPSRLRS
jgi:hypothetical protein